MEKLKFIQKYIYIKKKTNFVRLAIPNRRKEIQRLHWLNVDK